MIKKILFLLTFLLCLTGGGKLWAETYTLSISTLTSQSGGTGRFSEIDPDDATLKGGGLTIYGKDRSYSVASGTKRIKYSDSYKYTISGVPDDERIISITFEGCANDASVTTYMFEFNGKEYTPSNTPVTFPTNSSSTSSTSYTFSGSDITSGSSATFTVKRSSGTDGKQTNLIITVVTDKITIDDVYSDTYPYKWDFTVETAKWSKSKSQITDNTTNWVVMSNGNEARNKVTTAITVNDIDICKGLTFQADAVSANASSPTGGICLDWTTKAVWLNGTVTLPALSMGHKVTIVSAAAPTSVPSDFKLLSSTGTDSVTTIYQAKTDISAPALTFNGKHVYSIKVEKSDFTFSERKTQIYSNIVTKAASYTGTAQYFWIQANIPDFITNLSGLGITVTSSNSSVISTSGWSNQTPSEGTVWFEPFTTGTIGTAVLTFNFPGSAGFNPSSFSVTLNVIKGDPLLTFTSNDKGTHEIEYAAGSYSGNPLTYRSGVTTSKIEYSSNDTDVASIDKNSGAITINNAGKAVIRAVFEGNAYYNGAETFYTLYAKGTSSSATVTWDNETLESTKKLTIVKAANSVQKATSSDNATVYYKSSDSDIVTVNNDGHIFGRNPGVATVTAYTKGSGAQEGAETSCTVTVNGGVMSFEFVPSSGTMTVGCQLMPRLKIPSLEKSDITSLTLSVETESVSGVVTVVPNLLLDEYLNMKGTRIEKVYPLITANKVGTATVRATLVSPYYDDGKGGHTFTTDFNVTVTTETALFNWRNGSSAKTEYTITEGEYMMMPAIENSANGNINGLSNGSVCQSRHGYVYSIINGTPEWNNADYYYGQGVPDYSITPANGTAYIFWAKGEDTNHPVLMIYGKSAGDVTLRATDSQTGFSPADITIHVVSKADRVTGPDATFWSNKTFPFTWDFTNISAADITDDDVHWRKYTFNQSDPYGNTVNEHEHILGMTTSFPYDYADEDNNGVGYKGNYGSATAQMLKKYFVNGEGASCKIMPAFHGLRLQLGNNADGSFWSKRDKVKLYDKDDSNGGRLFLDGGSHFLYLPAMPAGNRPASAYRLYMKLKGRSSDSKVDLYYSEVEGGVNTDDFVSGGSYVRPGNDAARCYYFDIPLENAGKKVALAFDKNVEVYWIAFSTEAKSIGTAAGGSDHMASYSYSQTMDYGKSFEANNVDAYVATAVTNESSASNPALIVTLQKSNTSVPSGTGVVLKATDEKNAYMIADARNVDSYNDPEAPTGNLLIGTGKTGCTIYELAGDETGTTSGSSHVPFYLSSKFRDYSVGSGIGEQQNAGYYAYWRVYGTQSMPANYSYMVLDADTYKDTYGKPANINGGASSRILLAFDESDDDSGTTGVNSINNTLIDSDAWYTLQGVRVNAPTKSGIYIHKGKKVVVK